MNKQDYEIKLEDIMDDALNELSSRAFNEFVARAYEILWEYDFASIGAKSLEVKDEMMSNLKPCPFCGGEAERLTYPYDGKDVYVVMCKSCKARSPMYPFVLRHKSVEVWNKRLGGREWTN